MDKNIQEQIEAIAEKCARIRPLVVVSCITYNHEAYLRDALEGFVMQKADFPFVAVVHDDASTDGTAAIVREYAARYPDIILPIYEAENQYSKRDGSVGRIMREARAATGAKYVAYCEGDDYWTDPLKLQKQIDFLEGHPEYSMVCSNADFYIQDEKKLITGEHKCGGTFGIEYLFVRDNIETCTVVIRKEVLEAYQDDFVRNGFKLSFGDYPLWLYAMTRGKGMRLMDTMGVYRINQGGVSRLKSDSQRTKWMHSLLTVFDYFSENYRIDKEAVNLGYFIFFRHWAFFSAITDDKAVFRRAIKYYKENHYYATAIFLSIANKLKHPKKIFSFINDHNRIKPKAVNSFTPKL